MLALLVLAVGEAGATTRHKSKSKHKAKPVAAAPYNPTQTKRYAAIVIDAATGQVLFERAPDERRHPASLTKMMTLYLTFEALSKGRLSLDQMLPVSEFAESQSPTKLGLRDGQSIRVEDAVLGLVTKSANDAAVVLAETLAGNESTFAARMTEKARHLGMQRTIFRNASGLPDDDQVTSARDMALLGRALIRDHARFYHYFSRPGFTYRNRWHRNHNRLMARYEGMDGIKTGYVRASGFNLVASAVRNNRRLIAVVLGGPSTHWRDDHLADLLDNAFGQGSGQKTVTASRTTAGQENGNSGDEDDDEDEKAGSGTSEVIRAMASAQPGGNAAAPKTAATSRKDNAKSNNGKDSKDGNHKDKSRNSQIPAKSATAALRWGVQVGAYGDRSAGSRALAEAAKNQPKLFADAKPQMLAGTTQKHTVYRARLMGMTEKDARTACDALQKSGFKCAAVGP